MITMGSGRIKEKGDGWTISTADGSPAAHYEQTLVITRADPVILTAAA